jgi:CheY-like chemotaxis protein
MSGGEALAALRARTFDCMVMDLNLPDLSATSVLEKMAQEEVSFPPVIVYTGRSLSREQEHAAAALRALDRRQGRALAGAAAGRGHAVPAPGRGAAAGRAAADAPGGARRDEMLEGRRVLRRGRRPQRVRAVVRARGQGAATVDVARNGREALERARAPRRP